MRSDQAWQLLGLDITLVDLKHLTLPIDQPDLIVLTPDRHRLVFFEAHPKTVWELTLDDRQANPGYGFEGGLGLCQIQGEEVAAQPWGNIGSQGHCIVMGQLVLDTNGPRWKAFFLVDDELVGQCVYEQPPADIAQVAISVFPNTVALLREFSLQSIRMIR